MAKANTNTNTKPAGKQSNTTPPAVSTPPADPKVGGAEGKVTASGNDGKEYVIEKLVVVSAVDGFRRAGRAWSKEATEVLAEDLTDEQLEALLNEPMLTVTPVAKEGK